MADENELGLETEVTPEQFLAHYGKLGMKWGRRSGGSSAGGSAAPRKLTADGRVIGTRKELRAKNKVATQAIRVSNDQKAAAAKAAQKKATDSQDKKINDARTNLRKEGQNLKAAKKEYKVAKKVDGKVAAKQVLNKHKDKYVKTLDTAMLDTSREARDKQMVKLGGEIANVLLNAAVNSQAGRR